MPSNNQVSANRITQALPRIQNAMQYALAGEPSNTPQWIASTRAAKVQLDAAIVDLQSVQTTWALTQASYTTVLTGANNDLVFTAVPLGEEGNGITVTYVDPGGATATLGVVVTGTNVVVNLGRAASAINTTSALLKTAWDATATALALATVANSGADSGAGLVTAMTIKTLSGGLN